MTVAHPVRRVLARVCSADTMARVVDPTLADMRVESGRPAWRGYLALVRALTLYGITSAPDAFARVWSGDQGALARGLAACGLAAAVLAAPLIAIPAKSALHVSPYVVALLVPQALGLALPMSVLFAIPVAFRKAPNRRRLLMHGAVLSAVCAAANLVVMVGMIPGANQAFRVEVYRQFDPTHRDVALTPGPIEMTLHELRARIQAARATGDRLTPEGVAMLRRLEYTYQMKLALSAIPVPLGLLAIAITMAAGGRPRSIALGIAAAFAYVYGVWALDAWALRSFERTTTIPPAVFAWAPAVLVVALALTTSWRSRARQAQSWA